MTATDRGGGGSWRGGNEQRSANRRSQTQRAGMKLLSGGRQADNSQDVAHRQHGG